MGVAHSSERTPAHRPASKPNWVASSSGPSGPEAITGVPSRRESNAATRDGRAGNDDHQSERGRFRRRRKPQRRAPPGSREAARRMLRCVCEAPSAPPTGNHAPLFDSRASRKRIAPCMSPVTTSETTADTHTAVLLVAAAGTRRLLRTWKSAAKRLARWIPPRRRHSHVVDMCELKLEVTA